MVDIYSKYFEYRQVDPLSQEDFSTPLYLLNVITGEEPKILDFGCGFGRLSIALKNSGFNNIEGADISSETIKYCSDRGIDCHNLEEEKDFFEKHVCTYDYVIMSHVLEHVPKEGMVELLKKIISIIKPDGKLILMVPNAQSSTGAYWAYEDITHHTLFTSGSLYFVLRCAGFKRVDFVDIDCTIGLPIWKALLRKFMLNIYKLNKYFWNKVTSSTYHYSSPDIYSFEIKAVASLR